MSSFLTFFLHAFQCMKTFLQMQCPGCIKLMHDIISMYLLLQFYDTLHCLHSPLHCSWLFNQGLPISSCHMTFSPSSRSASLTYVHQTPIVSQPATFSSDNGCPSSRLKHTSLVLSPPCFFHNSHGVTSVCYSPLARKLPIQPKSLYVQIDTYQEKVKPMSLFSLLRWHITLNLNRAKHTSTGVAIYLVSRLHSTPLPCRLWLKQHMWLPGMVDSWYTSVSPLYHITVLLELMSLLVWLCGDDLSVEYLVMFSSLVCFCGISTFWLWRHDLWSADHWESQCVYHHLNCTELSHQIISVGNHTSWNLVSGKKQCQL